MCGKSTTNSVPVDATQQSQLIPWSLMWDSFKSLVRGEPRIYAANQQSVELHMPITTRALLQRHYLLAVPVKVHIKSIPGWPTGTQPMHLPTRTLLHHRPHRGSRSSRPSSSKIWARGHTAQRAVSRRAAGDEAHTHTRHCAEPRDLLRAAARCMLCGVGREWGTLALRPSSPHRLAGRRLTKPGQPAGVRAVAHIYMGNFRTSASQSCIP